MRSPRQPCPLGRKACEAAQGKQPGRPRKLSPAQLAMARAALREDQPVEQVAQAFGVSRATLYRYLAGAADAESSAGEPKGKKEER
ncbi:helix-turn-helix domain-containing protein [Nocardia rhamnosiphila]|uniref:helix-turn-helix domain-containing protein n=1 Tax=Nocardia rhamnosiphila TaxID=426716 RepID=UPI000561FC59|nr:helix-turn-helix domain-containing protein [Nocardia rhamnosiphila]